MLLIHRAERADALVVALGEVLRPSSGDPFRPETVAVPSKGVERWLAQQLSHVLGAENGDGVCANVLFPSYTRLLDDAAADADADYAVSVDRWSAGTGRLAADAGDRRMRADAGVVRGTRRAPRSGRER